MKTYTKKQLIAAQIKYNENYIKSPADFKKTDDMTSENITKTAEDQINYLLELADNDNG